MTVGEARRILGKLSEKLSDEEVERDLVSAEILKELFFNKLITDKRLVNDSR